jgi:hypothetical protein
VQGSQHVPNLVSKCLRRIHRIREVLTYSCTMLEAKNSLRSLLRRRRP